MKLLPTVAVAALAATTALTACGGGGNAPAAATGATIAFLRAVPSEAVHQELFLGELEEAGFVAGENLTVLAEDPAEVHARPGDARRTVGRWARRGVDLVVALSTEAARVAADAGGGVPVLFIANDPVATGLVGDERRPDRGMTGIAFRVPADRTLHLARRALPGLRRVGLLYPPGDPAAVRHEANTAAAAARLGMELEVATFEGPGDVSGAVEALAQLDVGAVVIGNAPTSVRALRQIEAAAARAGLPVVANTALADFAVLVLEPDTHRLWLQLGRQAVRLLGGSGPREVPVEDPAAYRIVVSRRAAASLGTELPADLLTDANEVIT